VASADEKKEILKYLWELTKILERSLKTERELEARSTKFPTSSFCFKKSHANTAPTLKLINRIITIIADIKKYILTAAHNPERASDKSTLYKVIMFRDHIFAIVADCFENDSKFLNSITLAIEEVIALEEEAFNTQLSYIILSPCYVFPGHANPEDREDAQRKTIEMVDESE
jgi:hypothetical protein